MRWHFLGTTLPCVMLRDDLLQNLCCRSWSRDRPFGTIRTCVSAPAVCTCVSARSSCTYVLRTRISWSRNIPTQCSRWHGLADSLTHAHAPWHLLERLQTLPPLTTCLCHFEYLALVTLHICFSLCVPFSVFCIRFFLDFFLPFSSIFPSLSAIMQQ